MPTLKPRPAQPPSRRPRRIRARSLPARLLPIALLLLGSCSSGGGGTGDLTQQRNDWDALVWDEGTWQ